MDMKLSNVYNDKVDELEKRYTKQKNKRCYDLTNKQQLKSGIKKFRKVLNEGKPKKPLNNWIKTLKERWPKEGKGKMKYSQFIKDMKQKYDKKTKTFSN